MAVFRYHDAAVVASTGVLPLKTGVLPSAPPALGGLPDGVGIGKGGR